MEQLSGSDLIARPLKRRISRIVIVVSDIYRTVCGTFPGIIPATRGLISGKPDWYGV